MGLQQRYIFACLAAAGGFFNLSGRYYNNTGRPFLSRREQTFIKNMATGETSQAITPYHFLNYSNFFGFYH